MDTQAELGIELGDTTHFSCPDCGRSSETVHGYLFDPAGDTAVYFAGYTPGHSERRANMVVSAGGWGEGMEPEDRTAVALQATFDGGGVEITFPPPRTSPWFGKDFLGKMRDPGGLSEDDHRVYRTLALAAIEKDPRVAAYRKTG
jgi:hypothetical protein